MRIFHNLFEKIADLENLILSWKEFKIGKKHRSDTLIFERHLEDNIWELWQDLRNETYKHSSYSSFYVQDPKLRHIHKASVRDRVLHHAIVKHLNPVFEPTFITDSFSCRIGKGTHKAVDRFLVFARRASQNFTRPCWVLKCDIRKYFASIDHHVLLDMLFKPIWDPNVRWLLQEVVSSFQSDQTIDLSEPKGVPIGNLTSQLFANVYLHEFDLFMKHELKEKLYIRYADDFVILHPDKRHCMEIIEPISAFLRKHLKLEMHPRKIIVRKFKQGVDFLGYVQFPNFRIPRLKTEKRIFTKVRENIELLKSGKLTEETFNASLNSYFGILQHCDAFALRQDLENQIFFWLNGNLPQPDLTYEPDVGGFEDFFEIDQA